MGKKKDNPPPEPAAQGNGKGKGKKGGAAEEPYVPPLSAKEAKKAAKVAYEAARSAEAEAMFDVGSDDDMGYDNEEVEDEELARLRNPELIEKVTKRLELLADGGTVDEEAKEVAALVPLSKKEAARKERMEKVLDLDAAAADADAAMAAAVAKSEAGGKINSKERKLVQRHQQKEEITSQTKELEDVGLSAFTLSLAGSSKALRMANAEAGVTGEDGSGGRTLGNDIIVDGFNLSAPKRELFVDAKLRLLGGRRYGLLGPNGRGKSTLLKHIAAGRFPLPVGVDVLYVEQEAAASAVSVVDQVIAADTLRLALLAEEAALLEQWEAAEVEDTWVEAEWAAAAAKLTHLSEELLRIKADAAEGTVRKILTGLGFTDQMQDGPTTILSGGWRMRVSLARALFVEPQLLLLDEPTNHLDLNAVLWLGEYLAKNWKTTLVVVSHDRDFLDEVCTDLIHLDRHQLFYYGGSINKFHTISDQERVRSLKDYQKQQKMLSEAKAGAAESNKKGPKSAAEFEELVMQKLGLKTLMERPVEYRVKFQFKSPEDPGPAISVLDASFGYDPTKLLFKNLSFKVDGATRVAIVGPNGVGKSTLLGMLTQAIQPLTGEVLSTRCLRLGNYNQHFDELLPLGKSGVQFLFSEYGCTEQEARGVLGRFGLDGARHLIRICDLSGGQKARVVMASLAMQAPHIMILDEPTNHLDMESVEALIDGVNAFEGGVVLVSHDARLIARTECDLWVCKGDQTVTVDSQGFTHYKQIVLRDIARKQEAAEAAAKEKVLRAMEARKERLAKMEERNKKRAAAAQSATQSAVPSAVQSAGQSAVQSADKSDDKEGGGEGNKAPPPAQGKKGKKGKKGNKGGGDDDW